MDLYSFLTLNDPSLNLIIEKEFPGNRCVGGKYTPATHTVTLYSRDIEIQCRRSLGSLNRLEDYTLVIFAHEMGHALDSELNTLSEQFYKTDSLDILYAIEMNAWNIAEKLIPFIDKELLQKIRQESLEHFSKRPLVS
jgi:hypothetical protein